MIIKNIKELENVKNYTLDFTNSVSELDQFVTRDKLKKPYYIKQLMDRYLSVAFHQLQDKKDIIKNYKLRNGEFDFNDYGSSEELKQIDSIIGNYEVTEGTFLKHYPIINSPLNTLKGELIGRPRRERVKAIDELSASEILQHRTDVLFQLVLEKIQKKYKKDEEGSFPEEYYKEINDKLVDYSTAAENWGNKALKVFKYFFNYGEKNEEGFMDFLTSATEFHHFYPDNSKIGFNYKIENPVNVWYLAQPNAKYTRDCHAIGTIEMMNISTIIDEYKLTKQELLELTRKTPDSDSLPDYNIFSPTYPDPNLYLWSLDYNLSALSDPTQLNYVSYGNQQYHIVLKTYFKGKKKLYKRTYLDDIGYQRTDYVDEYYKLNKDLGDLKLEEEWINQWYKCSKIGSYVYTEIEELEFNDTCPIVGIINHTKNTKGKSLLDLMKGYQAQYNICLNQIWDIMSKEIGVVFLGDLKLVPKKESDNPIEEMLWEAKEKGVIFIDSSQENTGGNVQFNQLSRIDLTRSAEIQSRIMLAQSLRNECWELIGISRQRTGSVLASETATGTNTALSQSYAQTEPWFKFHEDLMQQVLQTALNIMQWVELKKPESILNYLNSELDPVFFKINRNELLRNLFVFVTSAKEDKEILETLKGLLQPAMQNGAELTDAFAILTSDSESRIKKILKNIEEKKAAQIKQANDLEQQKLAQAEEQFRAQVEEARLMKEKEDMREDMNKQLDRENDIRIAEIKSIAFDRNETNDTENISEATKISIEQSKMNFDRFVKLKELAIKEKDVNQKLELAKYRDKGTKK